MLGGVTPQHPDKIFGGSSKPALQLLVVQILDLSAEFNITIRAIWVPRQLNTRADAVSHFNELDHCNYYLKDNVFHLLGERLWGPHSVDRFASDYNTHLPCFNSRFFSEFAEWIDCLTTSWEGENNYVFPPPLLIPMAIQQAITDRAACTLVVPFWKGAFWMHYIFPCCLEHRPAPFVAAVLHLGKAEDVLSSPSRCSHAKSDLPKGDLVAIRLVF